MSSSRASKHSCGWPDPEGVVFDGPFQALVEEMLDTAETAERFLNGGTDGEAVAPEDLDGLLGDGWRGGLTSFQQRDASRLLSLRHGANFSVPSTARPG